MFNFFCDNKKIKFNNAIEYAGLVLKEARDTKDNHPILEVIRVLGRTVQTQYLTHLLFSKERESRLPDIRFDSLFFRSREPLTIDGKRLYDLVERLVGEEREMNLSKDLILPWPWNRDRSISTMAVIGQGRKNGEWKQDDNHRIELWLPLGIAWVHGGNHSIAAGIVQGCGTIKTDYIFDVSNLYKYLYCDGKNYMRRGDNRIISPVQNVAFAAIFEIGRIMVENSISF